MIKRTAKIIHDARVFFFAFILATFLYQVGLNPIDFGKFLGLKVTNAAKMNVSAGVPPNPYNKIAAQLDVKEDKLNQREQDLLVLEHRIIESGKLTNNTVILSLSGAIFILFVMMSFNFYMDLRRKKAILKNSRLLRFFNKR